MNEFERQFFANCHNSLVLNCLYNYLHDKKVMIGVDFIKKGYNFTAEDYLCLKWVSFSAHTNYIRFYIFLLIQAQNTLAI